MTTSGDVLQLQEPNFFFLDQKLRTAFKLLKNHAFFRSFFLGRIVLLADNSGKVGDLGW